MHGRHAVACLGRTNFRRGGPKKPKRERVCPIHSGFPIESSQGWSNPASQRVSVWGAAIRAASELVVARPQHGGFGAASTAAPHPTLPQLRASRGAADADGAEVAHVQSGVGPDMRAAEVVKC